MIRDGSKARGTAAATQQKNATALPQIEGDDATQDRAGSRKVTVGPGLELVA
jgi:hypothetical protein